MEPKFIIKLEDRILRNTLSTGHLQRIKSLLLNGGTILIPSDTYYSLAAIPASRDIYDLINLILNRGKDEPMSLAFNNMYKVEYFVEINFTIANLLEVFTPGAITVVCKTKTEHNLGRDLCTLVEEIINSTDETIGVRIPDSIIEREVAAYTLYPVTTAAVRDDDKKIIQNLEQAIEIVSKGMEENDFDNWAIVEGDGREFVSVHSTVIRGHYSRRDYKIIREGYTSKEMIEQTINRLPYWESYN